jgi:hypothetical protein
MQRGNQLAIADLCAFGDLGDELDPAVDGGTYCVRHIKPGNYARLLGDDVTDHCRIGGDDGGAGGITGTDVFGEGTGDGALDVGMKFLHGRHFFRVYINPYPEL